jgi:hypothetical protein
VVKKAAEKKAKDDARRGIVEPEGATLRPASETGVAAEEPEHEVEVEVDDEHEHEHEAEHEPVYADEHDDED